MSNLAIDLSYDLIKNRQGYIPFHTKNFITSGIIKIDTANIIEPDVDFKEEYSPVLEINIGDKKFRLSKPIMVKNYKQGNLFFAENENLVLYGVGNNSQDALLDLFRHIVYFYTYYKNLNYDQLIGDAIRLKKIYSFLLKEQ